METVVDLHGDLTNLARVLARPDLRLQLYRRAKRVLMSDAVFEDSARIIRADDCAAEDPDIDRAFHYLVTAWLGRNGVAGTSSYNSHFCVRYTRNGGHAATRWANVKASIPAWGRRLERVTILRKDIFHVLPRIEDRAGTAIYVDPPYLVETRTADSGFGRRPGSSKYVHDFRDDDHRRLAEELGRFSRTRVVVSYYDDQRLNDLYPSTRWSRQLIEVSKALAHQGARGANDKRAVEALLVNTPSTPPHPMLFTTQAEATP